MQQVTALASPEPAPRFAAGYRTPAQMEAEFTQWLARVYPVLLEAWAAQAGLPAPVPARHLSVVPS